MIASLTGLSIFFLATVITTVLLFVNASRDKWLLVVIICGLGIVQSGIAIGDFYTKQDAVPPRFIFLLAPSILLLVVVFLSRRGRNMMDRFDLRKLTLVHSIRIPVEIALFYLYKEELVPVTMTFEGYNYDIISGLTAFVMIGLSPTKQLYRRILLCWNVVCLLLLINIVVIAILSAQTPFQQIGFDQPNKAVTFFPFVLLPSVIVPVVLLSHVAAIRQLLAAEQHRDKSQSGISANLSS